MSGPSTSEAPEEPTDTTPAQTTIRNARTALTEMELVQEALEHPAGPFATRRPEAVALAERVDAATKELWWIHHEITRLAAPTTPPGQP